ncbi:ferric reductase [Streptacidiphilus sp. PAMC 29251]
MSGPGSLPARLLGPFAADGRLVAALLATVLLCLVAAASAGALRRRLGHPVSHGLHMTSYAAVYLAIGHQLSGPDLIASPLMLLLWRALYLGSALLVARYRVLAPIRRWSRHRPRVAAVRREGPDVVSVYISGRHLDQLGARSGHFFRWRFLAPGLWWSANPYSLSAPPTAELLRITVKDAGRHSRALGRLRPGTRLLLQGPYGSLTGPRRPDEKVLLLAGGTGIAPLRALLETLPGRIVLLYYARDAGRFVLREEIDAIAAARGARVIYASDDAGPDRLPLTGRALRAAIPDLPEHRVYLAGPPGMTAAAVVALRRAGVPRGRLHSESFGG